MIENEPASSKTPNVLRDTLEEIEVLRITRQEEVRDHPHPFLNLTPLNLNNLHNKFYLWLLPSKTMNTRFKVQLVVL